MARKKSDDPENKTDDPVVDTLVEEAEPLDETALPEDAKDDPVKDVGGQSDTDMQPDIAPIKAPTRSGIWPMVLGGALAAALGFGASVAFEPQTGWFGSGAAIRQDLDRLNANTDALFSRLDDLNTRLETAQSDMVALEEIQSLQSDLETFADLFEGRSDGLGARISALEDRPVVEVAGSDEIAVAYEAELADLRAALEAQRAEMLAIASDASAKLEEAAAKAAEVENNAASAANSAAVRAALSRIQVAVETGDPYALAMSEIETASGSVAPDALVLHSEDGIVTLADLQQSFPDAARATLDLSRQLSAPDQGLGDRLFTFLRSQTGARSVTPRSGDDTDAILSRAEAALKDGRLTDTLAELAGLPETIQGPMANWRQQAEIRLLVLSAIQDWATTLSED